jgi:transglutaminase superfamily protein
MSRLRRLRPPDLWAFARAWIVLLVADIGLRLLPYPKLDRLLAAQPRKRKAGDEVIPRLAWATAAAARHHLYEMRCLPRALCLRWLLGRYGIEADLRIGVARQDDGLDAHAWVECQGRPVGEDLGVAERFAPMELL